jgi:hypothetical protein
MGARQPEIAMNLDAEDVGYVQEVANADCLVVVRFVPLEFFFCHVQPSSEIGLRQPGGNAGLHERLWQVVERFKVDDHRLAGTERIIFGHFTL